jgi:lipopolysaccharide/colanic/teichoic acid biosynthesis glycosyltransferase
MIELPVKEAESSIKPDPGDTLIVMENRETPRKYVLTLVKTKPIFLIKKRILEATVTVLSSIAWIPALIISSLAVLIFSGWPIFYISKRRVHNTHSRNIIKFRTMLRNAEKIVRENRTTFNGQIFLNIPINSTLYTPVGRIIEKICFTELPQLFHVLMGQMNLIGNRPLPENVINALKNRFYYAEDRFIGKCGIMGPIQLIGREIISDEDRLKVEIQYCHIVRDCYSIRLDLTILWFTVLIGAKIKKPLTLKQVEKIMKKYAGNLIV